MTPAHPTASAEPLALVKLMRGDAVAVVAPERGECLATVGSGEHPHAVAVDPSGRWAYLVFAGSGTVEVLDLESRSIVAHETVGTGPIGASLSADGGRLFVTSYGNLRRADEPGVTVLETTPASGTPTVTREIPLGKAAGSAVDTAGGLWVALKTADEVARVDTASELVTDRIEVPAAPQDVTYAPADGLLGVNCVDGEAVAFIDIDRRELLETVPTPAPRGGAVSAVHDRWLVGDTDGDGVTVVDIGGDVPTPAGRTELGTPTAFVDVHPTGEYAVVDAYDDDRIAFLRLPDGEVLTRVTVGETPRHPRFSPDGTRCYVPSVDDDHLAVVDTASLSATDRPPRTTDRVPLPADSAPSSCVLAATER